MAISSLNDFEPLRPEPIRIQVHEHVRKLILDGKLKPGEKLAPTLELARQWKVNPAIIQAALKPLVQEGLLHRSPRHGTVVAEKRKLKRVGVYFNRDVFHAEEYVFARTVCSEIMKLLSKRDVDVEIFNDARPEKDQISALPTLKAAIISGKIQALFVPMTDLEHHAWLKKLPVPISYIASGSITNRIDIDMNVFSRMAVQELHRLGCKTAGILTTFTDPEKQLKAVDPSSETFFRGFRKTAEELGIKMTREHIFCPEILLDIKGNSGERFGYEGMLSLLEIKDLPDGIVIYPDIIAKGALLALKEKSIKIPEEMELVIHRNREVGFFSPFTVSFVDVSISEVASSMIGIIESLMNGKIIDKVSIGYSIAREKVGKQVQHRASSK